MKRRRIAGIIPVFLLFACTGENDKKEETVPTPTTESQPNDYPFQSVHPIKMPTILLGGLMYIPQLLPVYLSRHQFNKT